MQEWFQASGGLFCSSVCIGDEKAVQTGAKRNSCSGLAGQAIRSRQLPPARCVGPPSISSETGLHDNTRQLTLTARLWEGLERGGRHGLKPMLRPPSTGSGTISRRSFAWWLSAHGMAKRRAIVRRVAGLCGQRAAGQECPDYGCRRTTTTEYSQLILARQEPRPPKGGALRALSTSFYVEPKKRDLR